jgi:hypothetical protein
MYQTITIWINKSTQSLLYFQTLTSFSTNKRNITYEISSKNIRYNDLFNGHECCI